MRLLELMTLMVSVAAGGCASTPAHASAPPPPPASAQMTIDVFVDALSPYGEWIVVGRYGRVWRPLAVTAGWRPYLYGEWVWTEDGWFWVTDEPWGWATYHYGRWAFEPGIGWIWVPGFVWAPAWVAWRVGDGFVGWAPLYPGFDIWWVDTYPIVHAHWVFVPTSRFVGTRVHTVAFPTARAPTLLRSSRPAPPRSVRPTAEAPPLGGPVPRLVEERVGRPIRPAPVVAVPTPAEARGRSERGAVPVFRPAPVTAGAPRPEGTGSAASPSARPAPGTPAQPPVTTAPERAAPARPAPERPAPAQPAPSAPARPAPTPRPAPGQAPTAEPRPAPTRQVPPARPAPPSRSSDDDGTERSAPQRVPAPQRSRR